MQHFPIEQYSVLLHKKQQMLATLLAPFDVPEIEVFDSPQQYYRMRAEFRIWHERDDLYHIMFDQETGQRYRVDNFPIASKLINQMMGVLLAQLKEQKILAYKLFQIDYLSTLSNKMIISLLYHKVLTDEWRQAAQKLKTYLEKQGFDVQIIGRASKQKICLEQDYVDEILSISGKDYVYRQVENSFTQPNAVVNAKMLTWALSCTKGSVGDLLELYCGNGNFSIVLAQNFRQVLATEIAKPSVAAAQFNIVKNGINNLQIVRLSAQELTQAIKGVREFNRLQHIDLKSYQCDTVFIDPPRAGLDPDTLALVQNYERILYISCNPHTLYDNLQQLWKTHRIVRAALFDQFPYTEHIESGVWLVRK